MASLDRVGWRAACWWIGIAVLLLLAPLNLLLRKRPEDLGLEPDGDRSPRQIAGDALAANVVDPAWVAIEWTLARSIRTARFCWIAVGYLSGLYASYAVQVHQTKYLVEIGFSASPVRDSRPAIRTSASTQTGNASVFSGWATQIPQGQFSRPTQTLHLVRVPRPRTWIVIVAEATSFPPWSIHFRRSSSPARSYLRAHSGRRRTRPDWGPDGLAGLLLRTPTARRGARRRRQRGHHPMGLRWPRRRAHRTDAGRPYREYRGPRGALSGLSAAARRGKLLPDDAEASRRWTQRL
jgi:hypothetical protein